MKTFLVTFERTIITQHRMKAESVADLRRYIEAEGAHEVAMDAGILGADETRVKRIEVDTQTPVPRP